MQLSAATLFAAAQQSPRQAPQAQAPTFAPELSATQSKDEGFAPLAFKQTAAPAQQTRPGQAQPAPSRPGATLDIKI
jgi:hypothetical protein